MNKTTFQKLAFTVSVLAVALLQVLGKVEITWTSLALIGMAMLPWASAWLTSIRIGDFEAKFRELQEEVQDTRREVVETRREIDTLKAAYQTMDEDYLAVCNEFDPNAPVAARNALASRLKALARGLQSIDFLIKDIASQDKEGQVLGIACALHVHPQFEAITGLVELLNKLSGDKNLMNFCLKTVYRLLMAVDEIVKLNLRNKNSLLDNSTKATVIEALEKLKTHPRCATDDTGKKCESIIKKLNTNT